MKLVESGRYLPSFMRDFHDQKDLFKAKRLDNDEWVYGYLFKIWERTYILWGTTNGVPNMHEVKPITVCESTGLYNNKKQMFEHDICKIIYEDEQSELMTIVWDVKKAGFYFEDKYEESWIITQTPIEIVGNIYDTVQLPHFIT